MDYCLTDEMLAEFFTKPLQDKVFESLRRIIMGWDHISILKTESMSEFKEHFGNGVNYIFNPKMDSSPNRTRTHVESVTGD